MGQGTFLTPTGHAAVNQFRVTGHAFVRAEPQSLHYPGAHRIDERVGALDEPQNRFDAFRMFQVDRDRRATAAADIRLGAGILEAEPGRPLAVDADDVRAHVGQ